MRSVAVPLRRAFPHADRRQMRRLLRGDLPLIDREVRNSVEAYLAAAPRLFAGPGDAGGIVAGLPWRKGIDEARGAPAATAVNADAGVAVRHPFLRVHHFPVLVKITGAGDNVGMLARHGLPGVRI